MYNSVLYKCSTFGNSHLTQTQVLIGLYRETLQLVEYSGWFQYIKFWELGSRSMKRKDTRNENV